MKIYCEHTALPTTDGGWELCPAFVEIDGTEIHRVAKWSGQTLSDDTLILKDRMLTPAFVNAHTHLAMSFFRALSIGESASDNMVTQWYFKIESRLSPEDVRAFARMGAYESLLFGVGFVWDHYYHGEAVAKALEDVGLSGAVAPTLQDLKGPGAKHWEREWRHTESIADSSRFLEKGIVAAFGPHATDTVSPSLWKMIREAREHSGLPLHAHLAQSRDEFQTIQSREGCTPLQFLERMGILSEHESVFAHGIYLNEDDLKTLSKHPKATLVSCPFSQMIFEFPANVCEWERSHVQWAIATDCTPSNDSFNLQKELRMISGFPLQKLSYSPHYDRFREGHSDVDALAKQRKEIWDKSLSFREPESLLSKVWNIPGKLHPQVTVGTIAQGALANLLVWNLDHPSFWPSQSLRAIAFNDCTAAIDSMMVAGQWLGEKGNFAGSILNSPNYREALQEANARLQTFLTD